MTADSVAATRLLTRKSALAESRLHSHTVAATAAAGEVLLRIDRFALSTNNITYGAFGNAMQYWHFFPTGQPEWGQMPAWGIAEVVCGGVCGLQPGERFFGYYPIATHVVMRPQRVTERGFYDGAVHRQTLNAAYNQYIRCDPGTDPAREALQMLLRPLHITSFMLADYLQENRFFGAQCVLFSSASSKTAYGTAFELRERLGIHRVALTSERNLPFVENLGLYDRVSEYGRLHQVPADRPTLYIDFSGDPLLRERIHHQFHGLLVHDCFVGSARCAEYPRESPLLPGPKPVFFFAPEQIRKRHADWGWEGFNERMAAAEKRFYDRAVNPLDPWIVLVEHEGLENAQAVLGQLCAGTLDPQQGQIVRL